MTSPDSPASDLADAPGDLLQALPLSNLIGGPLIAALEAQIQMANATENFIKAVGYLPSAAPGGAAEARTVSFEFARPVADESDPTGVRQEQVRMDVPLLALVKIPNLQIDKMDLAFEVAVTGWGSVAGGDELPTAEGVLAGPHSALKAPGYAITMKAVSAEPTDAMARVMDELTKAITPVVQPR